MKYLFLLDFDKTIIDFDSYTRLVLFCSKSYQKIVFMLFSILHKFKLINNSKFKLLVNSYVFDFFDEKNKAIIFDAVNKIAKNQPELNIIYKLPPNSDIVIISATYAFIVREFMSHYKIPRDNVKILGDDYDFFPGYLKGKAFKEFASKNNIMLSDYSFVVSYSDSISDISLLSVSDIFYLVKKGKIIDEFQSRR